MTLSIQLVDGRWLNAVTRQSQESEWAMAFFVSLISAAVAIVIVVILVVRRLTRPLRALTDAAERVGRGEDVPDLPEKGPKDVRQTTRAFNRMQGRLHRFVHDRTQMLAAVSHDLRSPITVLRLRTEFIEDSDTRQKISATLDEMESMTDAALAFVREDSVQEQTQTIDLTSLVDAVCADLADTGAQISFAIGPAIKIHGRSVSIKRAVRNLLVNAITYGIRARVSLQIDDRRAVILVEDDGPGISADLHEQVFAPFFRAEESRNRETGGVGLGLSIARTIARAHGGDVTFDRSEGGMFQVILSLPIGPDS